MWLIDHVSLNLTYNNQVILLYSVNILYWLGLADKKVWEPLVYIIKKYLFY